MPGALCSSVAAICEGKPAPKRCVWYIPYIVRTGRLDAWSLSIHAADRNSPVADVAGKDLRARTDGEATAVNCDFRTLCAN